MRCISTILYTPIVADQDIEIDYESAKQIAREALMPLGQDYQRMLEEELPKPLD